MLGKYMKKLYRLECEPQHGVYSSMGNATTEIRQKLQLCRDIMMKYFETLGGEKHPSPYDDTRLMDTMLMYDIKCYDVFYGFSSIDQFRAWFYSDGLLTEFDKIGVTLVCYNTSFVYNGNTQAVASLKDLKAENVAWRITLKDFLEKGISHLTELENCVISGGVV